MSEILYTGIHDLYGKKAQQNKPKLKQMNYGTQKPLKKRKEGTEYSDLRIFKFPTCNIFILVSINSKIALAM